ncbi:MAG TPA: hypothetical protein VGR73_10775 [Bryobacteraceae bacterium]|nr:hypothetical protein [Bryobacteraceae bacterium]
MQVADSHPGAGDGSRKAALRQLTQAAVEGLGNMSRTPGTASLANALRSFVGTIDPGGGPGFTVFFAPDEEAMFLTPGVRANAVAAERFHVLPLLALAAAPSHFYALGVSRNAIRLWDITPFGCEEVVLPHSVPASLAADGAFDKPDHDLENRSSVGVGTGTMHAMRFGTQSDHDFEAEYLRHFLGRVAKGLRDVVQDAPVFLVGTRPDTLAYRRAARGAAILDAELHCNPEHCSTAEVETHARLAAGQEFYRQAEAAIVPLPEIPQKIAGAPAAIFTAASEGRVHQLFLAEAARMNAAAAHVADLYPGDDVYNAAAIETLRAGGAVYLLPGDALPTGGAMTAVLRY